MKNKVKIAGVLLFLFTILGFGSSAYACEPTTGSPWFTQSIQLNSSNLPSGVTITRESTEFNSYSEEIHGPLSRIKNTSDTPLYLLPKPSDASISPTSARDTQDIQEPNKPKTTFKLVSGKMFFTYLPRSVENVWAPNFIWEDASTDSLLLPWYDIRDYAGIEINTTTRDDRPRGTKAPETQDFSLLAVYGKTPLNLKGTVTYKLNPDYNPKAHANDPCSRYLDDTRRDIEFRRNYPLFPIMMEMAKSVMFLLLICSPFILPVIIGIVIYLSKNKQQAK